MESVGVNLGYLNAQVLFLLIFIGWPLLTVIALLRLHRRALPETARAIWAVVILLIPIFGVVAFYLVRPGKQPN